MLATPLRRNAEEEHAGYTPEKKCRGKTCLLHPGEEMPRKNMLATPLGRSRRKNLLATPLRRNAEKKHAGYTPE